MMLGERTVRHRLSLEADVRDARVMLWISRQAQYARDQERRYGRGKRLRRVHPLARIGMGT